MRAIRVGARIEDFVLPDQFGALRRLSDLLAGGPVVLFFYPYALTCGCTVESCQFRDLAGPFAAVGAQPVGISCDSQEIQRQFDETYSLGFPLLSDTEAVVVRAVGVKGFFNPVRRTTLVIDPDRTVVKVIASEFSMDKHAEQALAFLRRRRGVGIVEPRSRWSRQLVRQR